MQKITPLKASRDRLLILDQRKLPLETIWVEANTAAQVAHSITEMHVRGAPAIGIAAAYGFYLEFWQAVQTGKKITPALAEKTKALLDRARPTAVNLMWATAQMREVTLAHLAANPDVNKNPLPLLLALYDKASEIHADDAERCLKMSEQAVQYIRHHIKKDKYRILTHCNTGALATGGIGTALGVIRLLHRESRVEHVFANETRPYLQGSRLTAWELTREKIPATLIVDSMAGWMMKRGEIDFVVVGADRITRRGDVANKIGTYAVSVLAKAHKLPFFVVAPRSTYDASIGSGEDIPIEERPATEVTQVQGITLAPKINVRNYSFDVTPRENITALFFEDGVLV